MAEEIKNSLLRFISKDTEFVFQDKPCVYVRWFTVAFGGYATHDVAEFVFDGGLIYFSVDIVDSQFGILGYLNGLLNKAVGSLTKMELATINGYMMGMDTVEWLLYLKKSTSKLS